MNTPKDISTLYRKMNMRINILLADMGLTGAKALFLFCLNEHGKMTQKDICDKLDMDKSTVAKMLVRLEKDGFVVKQRAGNDARAYHVQLTQKAKLLVPKAQKIQDEWIEKVTQGFTQSEKSNFYCLLEKAANAANKTI